MYIRLFSYAGSHCIIVKQYKYLCRFTTNSHPMRVYINQLESTLSEETFSIRIRRSHVLHDALIAVSRRTFNPYKSLIVSVIYTG